MRNININFNFMVWHRKAVYVSLFLIFVSLVSIFTRGLNYGVDFNGGTIIEISFENSAPIEKIRNYLQDNNYEKSSVQYFGSNKDILIRIPNIISASESSLSNTLISKLNNEYTFSLKRVEYVGAQVGEELRDQGILAALIALALIMIYITLRFEYRFSIGAILALLHDVFLIIGIFSITQIEFNLSVFAAILAVIGYSLNDTIVVFDRIRENFKNSIIENIDTEDLTNSSINQTLSRTLITSLTTLLVLISLLIFGGEILFGFSFALIAGVIIGTYSSIYIASSTLLIMNISVKDIVIEIDEDKP
ncbi:MAG: protein translocase subunit SecF [Gammaproteobacteria bacterium]|nr:protein translocase subunit SecF [Gammaproteobacteria bacterium]